ncbi:MAG: TIGR04372 family glycosyltransferase [Desulfomonile tiedjei]|nr:TIGR04372 family glycosyltransferase [Desulfomonile tiedjei]
MRRPIRFLNIPCQHIGHLAVETDCFVKEGLLGRRPDYRGIVLCSKTRVSNPSLLKYIKTNLTVITNPFVCAVLKPLARAGPMQYDVTGYAQIVGGTSLAPTINREWGDRTPVWRLSDEDIRRGRECLRSFGLTDDSWFVCVHCREPGYLQWDIHDYRDVNVHDYIPAMQAIVERGGWCLRMGDPSMQPLPKLEGVIDYCHSDLRSDWMDVFLCASSRFFLGSGSGLYWVSGIFGVPVACANFTPMSSVLALRPGDLGIPKLVWSETDERLLPFRQVLGTPIGDYRFTLEYENSKIRLIDNKPEDVKKLAEEMLDKTEGKAVYTEDDRMLQENFLALLHPGHFSYGSGARVGRDFLRDYRALM